MRRVVVVDGGASIRGVLGDLFRRPAWAPLVEVTSGERGIQALRLARPDLSIVNVVPAMEASALDFIETVRHDQLLDRCAIVALLPVVSTECARRFHEGADLCMSPEWVVESPGTFHSFVECVLERRDGSTTPVLHVDSGRQTARYGNTEHALSECELRILSRIIETTERVVTHAELAMAISRSDDENGRKAVRRAVAGIRSKLKSCPGLIETVSGVGYRAGTRFQIQVARSFRRHSRALRGDA